MTEAKDELHEDWFNEITRKYSEAIGSGKIEVLPAITKPTDIESYRQERAFYSKHGATEMSDSTPNIPNRTERRMAAMDKREHSTWGRFVNDVQHFLIDPVGTVRGNREDREARREINDSMNAVRNHITTSYAKAQQPQAQGATASASYWDQKVAAGRLAREAQPDLFSQQTNCPTLRM